MTCNECLDLMPLFAMGEGPDGRRRELDAHLAACARCSDQFRRLNDICRALKEDGESDQLSELEQLQLERTVYRRAAADRHFGYGRWSRPLSIAGRIAAALVLFSFGYYAHSLVTAPESAETAVTTESSGSSPASYELEISRGLRFSAAGLKAIAHGRRAAMESLSEGPSVSSGTR